MRAIARVVLAVQLAAAAVLVVTQVAASAQSPAPSASPSASSTPSAAPPSATPAASAAPASSPSPASSATRPAPGTSPTPAATSTPPVGEGVLEVSSASTSLLVQLGHTVHYRVVVANTGDAPLHDVFVVDLLPREVTFVSAPLPDQVEAALYGKVGSQENVTWNVGTLRPGQSLTLPWSGIAADPGDMTAVNSVHAEAAGVPRARREDRTYVGTSSSAGGVNPAPTPTKTTVVTVSRVPAGGVLGSPDAAGETMPLTGLDPGSTLLLATLLLVAGGVAWWGGAKRSRRTKVIVALTALAVLAACTASRDEAAPGLTISPQVKGKRIDKNGDGTGDDGSADASDASDANAGGAGSEDGPAAADSQTPSAPPPAPAPRPSTVLVRTTRIVTVAPVLRPPVALESRAGDNALTYTWAHDSGSILAASSSTSFDPSSPARIETSVESAAGATHAIASITNTSQSRPLVIDGRISYDVRSGSGRLASLVSGPIRMTLNPGGSARVRFDYDLPSGTYSVTSRYEAN